MFEIKSLRRNLLKTVALLGLCSCVLGTTVASAQENALRIAAVVNDDVISMLDVSTRMRIALHSARLPATNANSKRMLPQVLRTLIDEKLQQQQAKALNVKLSDADLESAIRKIEQNNNMPSGGLKNLAASLQVPYDAFKEQIHTQALWSRTVGREFGRQTKVSDLEAKDRLQELQSNLGKPEHMVSEIYLPYSAAQNAQSAQELKRLASDLAQQLQNGAQFIVAARQFSRSPTANRGGDLGWVPQGQLEPELDQALAHMAEGQVSNPIATQNGYYILRLSKRRTLAAPDPSKTRLSLSQIKLPLVGNKALSPQDQNKVVSYIQNSVRGCEAFNTYGKTLGTTGTGPLGSMRLNEMPTSLQQSVGALKVGQPSQLLDLGGVPTVLMVCERIVPSALPTLDAIKKQLQMERLERSAQRLLNNLRRDAIIDIRI